MNGPDRADRALAGAVVLSLPVLWRAARHQWFIRDDWAFLISRPTIRAIDGNASWLLTPQDGHWMTVPLLVFRLLQNVFGLGSYGPFLLPVLALHVATVLLARTLCRRHGVSPWTTTVLSALLLVFGSGWENIVFAVQLTYDLSLVCFLAAVLLVDHDGPLDRRDVVGGLLAVVAVMSSGFGPFFVAGLALVLVARRRRAAAVAVAAPAGLLWAWWWLAWGSDSVGDHGRRSATGALKYARLGLTATLNSVTGQVLFAGAAFGGMVAVACWRGMPWGRRAVPVVLAAVTVVVFVGIGFERAALGIDSATVSRYQYVGAVLLIPLLGLAVDQVARYHRRALVVVHVLLAVSVVQNARLLVRDADAWAGRSGRAGRLFALVAGDPAHTTAGPGLVISQFDPDVTVGALATLVDQHAIVPVAAITDTDCAAVAAVLAGHPADLTGGFP